MSFVSPSPVVWFAIPGLALLVGAAVVYGWVRSAQAGGRRPVLVRASAGVAGYFAVSGALAASGVLGRATHGPPPMLVMMAALSATTIAVATSSAGARLAEALPLWALVGSQAFRLPLELVLHRAATDGTMPVEMSFVGRNFDVVSGATALLLAVALYRRRISTNWVIAWNLLGTLLLLNVVTVAILALPWIHAFGTDHMNTWVLHFPFVWLPAVLVQAALFGHVVVFRRVLATASVVGF